MHDMYAMQCGVVIGQSCKPGVLVVAHVCTSTQSADVYFVAQLLPCGFEYL